MSEFSLADYPAMPPAPLAEQTAAEYAAKQALRRKIGEVATSVLLVLPATAIAMGIAEIPAGIDAGPGIAADARVQIADYSGVGYGPTTFGFPKAQIADIHGVGVGVKLSVTKLDSQNGTDEEQTLAAIADDPGRTLGPEIEKTFIERGVEGVGGGLAVYGFAGLAMQKLRRRRTAEADADERQLAHLESIDNLPDAVQATLPAGVLAKNQAEITALRQKKQHRETHPLQRKLTAIVATASVLAAGALVREGDSLTPAAASRTVILSKDSPDPYIRSLVADEPVLDGAFATSYLGHIGKEGLTELTDRVENVNSYWRGQAKSFTGTVLPEFLTHHDLAWLNDPNWVSFVDITDAHNKLPFMQYFLPAVLQALEQQFGIKFVVNTGDQENYSDQYILDNGAEQRMANALPLGPDGKPIEEEFDPGNHDRLDSKDARKATAKGVDGKSYHPINPLDKADNYTITVDGVTFVGSPDLNRTGKHGTVPATKNGQMANDAKQGELLAQKAQEVYEKTHKKPIVLAHEPEAGYASIIGGNAAAVFDGHWHQELPLKAYVSTDDSVTLQQIQGSASGDGPNDVTAMYNKATITGYMSMWFVNKLTGEMREVVITVDPSGGLPTMTLVPQPQPDEATPAADDPDIQAFASKYDPKLLLPHGNTDGIANVAAGHH